MSKSVAVVTGASQGIGRATAIPLARDFSALGGGGHDGRDLEEASELGQRRDGPTKALRLVRRRELYDAGLEVGEQNDRVTG